MPSLLTNRFRIVAALVLLLLAGVDIAAVDMAGNACSDSENHEDCFCCCRHVMMVPSTGAQPFAAVESVTAAVPPSLASRPPATLFHPPRA